MVLFPPLRPKDSQPQGRITGLTHLGVEAVGQAADELALDRRLAREQRQVVRELVVCRDDHSFAARVELRPARAPEDLQHVQHAQVHERALLGVVNLRALQETTVTSHERPRWSQQTAQIQKEAPTMTSHARGGVGQRTAQIQNEAKLQEPMETSHERPRWKVSGQTGFKTRLHCIVN